MPKRCPPGVICIENITIIFLISLAFLATMIYYKINDKNNIVVLNSHQKNGLYPKTSSLFSNVRSNILMNPYSPPLKNNHFSNDSTDPRGIPININTRGFDTSYKQVGILTRNMQRQGDEVILAIMGRPLYSNRSKWQYYTMNDKSNAIKLPMSHNGRSCTNEYGCDELTSGDTVYVEGYNDAFKVTIYENSQPRYIPIL
tara:strand:+ start:3736 stop:4335 length:600 start_codon:yes stop_codon:yes gene_type:complete